MGPSRASCICNQKGSSTRLSLSPCRGMSSASRTFAAPSIMALTSRLRRYDQAADRHSMSVEQRLSCGARRIREANTIRAQAADLASGTGRGSNINSSSGSTSEAGRENSAVQFQICRIPGDGSCLFRALAQGVHQLETGALLPERQLLRAGYQLRSEVCREMTHRREEFEPFITGIFDAYMEAMALEGCWGGEPELAAAIHCLQRPIVVYKQVRTTLLGEKTLEKVSVYGAEEYPGKSPVCVLFSGAHYDTLLQVPAR